MLVLHKDTGSSDELNNLQLTIENEKIKLFESNK